RSNDKADCYAMLHEIGVRAPAFERVRGGRAAARAAEELGYPDRDVCFKPVFSSGSRGFRILSASADRQRELLENRPGVAGAMQPDELVELLPEDGGPEILVMELAIGGERTIDGIAEGGAIALGHPKTAKGCAPGSPCTFARSTIPA